MKSNKQKMLDGEAFIALDPEIIAIRAKAQELTHRYNQIVSNDRTARHAILQELLGKTPERCSIESEFHCDYGMNIFLGENFIANFNLTILDIAKVTIGDNVLIAPNVQIYTVHHPLNATERATLKIMAEPISIGNDVWIGGGVIILPGVTIGEKSIIGAGSVVTKDIPPNCLAYGNPCRVIRTLHENQH
jgi:maltose O-acetyltransferase